MKLELQDNTTLVRLAEKMILELSEDPKNQPQVDMHNFAMGQTSDE
jgi:hypothetical protein